MVSTNRAVKNDLTRFVCAVIQYEHARIDAWTEKLG